MVVLWNLLTDDDVYIYKSIHNGSELIMRTNIIINDQLMPETLQKKKSTVLLKQRRSRGIATSTVNEDPAKREKTIPAKIGSLMRGYLTDKSESDY